MTTQAVKGELLISALKKIFEDDYNTGLACKYFCRIEGNDGETGALKIDFPANGLLPGIATIKIKADYTLREYGGIKDLYLYYYDPAAVELDFIRKKLEISKTRHGLRQYDCTDESGNCRRKSNTKSRT